MGSKHLSPEIEQNLQKDHQEILKPNETDLRLEVEKYKNLYRKSLKAEELYRSLLNSSADAIVIYDMEGNAQYISDSFTQIFGWKREELLGRRIPYVPEPEKNITFEQIERLLSGQIIRSVFETQRFTRDSRILDIRVSASRYHDREGNPAGMLAILSDITPRKKAERALARSEKLLKSLSAQMLHAQENERKRVALELHDGIQQSLTAIKFRLENVIEQIPESESEPVISLKSIVPLIQNAVEEIRKISMALRPSMLDDLGVLATIDWFCQEFQFTCSDIHIDQEIDIAEHEIREHQKIVIFRIIQEAFNNIAKHSKADHVFLQLKKRNRNIDLIIKDNGIGFDPDLYLAKSGPKYGFGLASMWERAEVSGGSLRFDTGERAGTCITAKWPMVGPFIDR